MSAFVRSSLIVAITSMATLAWTAECAAASRDECVEAHGRGQELREKGQLSRARQSFMTCAQSSCPGLIQADCARFNEELAQLVPTVTFGARDASASDLPNTTVYVDDVQLATRLDDGKSYELDPGKHVVRYVHDGKETTVKVVLNQGEKGRLLLATFNDGAPPAHADVDSVDPPAPPKRSPLPLVVSGVGAAAAITGAVLYAMGMAKVPGNCSVSTKECSAPPNDPVFDQARSGVALANIGGAVGVAGAAVMVGGLVWYFVQPLRGVDTRRGMVAPGVVTF